MAVVRLYHERRRRNMASGTDEGSGTAPTTPAVRKRLPTMNDVDESAERNGVAPADETTIRPNTAIAKRERFRISAVSNRKNLVMVLSSHRKLAKSRNALARGKPQ